MMVNCFRTKSINLRNETNAWNNGQIRGQTVGQMLKFILEKWTNSGITAFFSKNINH